MKRFSDSRPKLLRKLSFAGLVVSTLMWSHMALSAPSNNGDSVTLNFANADIQAVIQAISKISGRNFIVDPRVKGTINITTSTPVAKDLTYSILLSALRLQGYAAVEGKDVTKIVPESDAKLHAAPVGKSAGTGDRLATKVFVLKHESATQVVPIIRPLVSPNNTVSAFPGNNTLVVTDYSENLERISRIIESIDLPQGDIRIIQLQHASAIDLATTINRLMNEGFGSGSTQGAVAGDTSQRLVVVGDMLSNSLLVRSENPSKLNAIRQLVSNLDKPGAAGNIHVVYLKNAEANRVAQILRGTLSGDTNQQLSQNIPQGGSFAPPQQPSSNSGRQSSDPAMTSQPAGQSPIGAMSNAGNSGVNTGNVSGFIQADPMNNALIITAPDAIYNNLRRVIDQLDRRRAQVYIEALIVEVNAEKSSEIGIQWQAGKIGSDAVAGTNFSSGGNNILNLATGMRSVGAMTLPGAGLNMILGSGTVTVGGTEIANLHMLARFLETDGRANILSTPNLVTLDNEEAKIVVGRNLPFVTGQFTTNTGGVATVGNPFQTIERRDVGLTLKVKPQISEGGVVKLQIYQEASSVSNATAIPGLSNNSGPVTNKRSIESTVLVDDGATVALGGLVEDLHTKDTEKVPLLGDIPYLGALFRYESQKHAKTNLIVFLRPVVLRDAASYQGFSNDRYNYIIDKQRGLDQASPATPALLPERTATTPLSLTPVIQPASDLGQSALGQ